MNSLVLFAVAFLVTGAIILWFCDVHAHIEIDIKKSDKAEDNDTSNKDTIIDNSVSKEKKRKRKKIINTTIISAAIVDIIVGIIILLIEYNAFI